MQLRPELRFSGGTSGVKSDAEPGAKSIQTWSLTRTHTGERALTHCREKENAFFSSGLCTLLRQCG